MSAAGASDLHLCAGSPPIIRKDGRLQPLDPAAAALSISDLGTLLKPIMPEKNRAEFDARHDTDSFRDALRAALREDPDIILVGELRDLETVAIAIETAETGHLVFGTLHTTTAASTIDRVIDQFPSDRQAQIRIMLSESLKGVISQTLCKKIGGGRAPALQGLIGTSAGRQ